MDTRSSHSVKNLYPPLSPHDSGWLTVGDGHELYWEVSGNRNGKPALFLHGGPGGSSQSDYRRLFDPETYRIVLFDQRGCGRSRPKGSLEANTTQHLVADIEKLRTMLKVEDWLILGGSWGAALALAYAQQHTERVRALVLRGVFTARQREVDWLYKFGASSLFPEAWQRFIGPIPPAERNDLVAAYHRRLTHENIEVRREAARTWCAWESELLTLLPRTPRQIGPSEGDLALARIEAHYFINNSFFAEGQLLENMQTIAHIPGIIVQGRYDVVTPPQTAFEVATAWPKCKLHIVNDAGHATSEPGILAGLVEAADSLRKV